MAGKRTIEALSLYKKGFNCAQAVILPFAEELGLDKSTAMKISEGFGAGMGNCLQTCGALSGAVMVAGLKNCNGDLIDHSTKKSTYDLSRELNEAFKKECGSCICCEIKGLGTGQLLKTCDECVMVAAALAEKVMGK